MAISFDDEQIVSKDNVPYIIPRDANYDTMSILGGFDATNTFRFGQFTAEGKLKVDASISIEHIDIGDVNIQVVGPSGADLLLSGDLNPGSTTAFLYVQDARLGFTGDSLNVNITGSALPDGASTEETLRDILEALGGSSSLIKQSFYGEAEVAPGDTPVTIVEYEVEAGTRFRIDGIRGWADVDAEFLVTINSVVVDGYRTTPANLTMSIESEYIQYAIAGQVVRIEASHSKQSGDWLIKAVLQGAVETI